jgi:hypothetical protein
MKQGENQLLDVFAQLAPEQQERLIAFAEFLAVNPPDTADIAREPVATPRPDNETVTLAIRRLVRTYPMLDRRRLMAEASRFLAQHALEGRAANEVIDELEGVFARHYQQFRSECGS